MNDDQWKWTNFFLPLHERNGAGASAPAVGAAAPAVPAATADTAATATAPASPASSAVTPAASAPATEARHGGFPLLSISG